MSEDSHQQPATTVRELGIQFNGFMSLTDERFKNMNDAINRLAKALEDSNSTKADLKDVIELRTDFETFKTKTDLRLDKKPWVAIFLSGTLMTVLTATVLYVVNDLIGGK